jgi:hypothetical protein
LLYHALILDPCTRCGHKLHSEVLAAGSFRVVAYFDDDPRSATHAERVERCPKCGANLGGEVLDASRVGMKTRIHPTT